MKITNKNTGFTLAEVLITLGVIGVVAALTIPGLLTDIQNKDKSAKLKKFYSTMKQAILSAEDEFGALNSWDANLPAKEYVQTYLAPFIKFSIDENSEYNTSTQTKIIFSDGTTASFTKGRCWDVLYDVNGNGNPNRNGYDIFTFLMCDKSITEWCAEEGFCTYRKSAEKKLNSRQTYLNLCKQNAYKCSALLEYDNWIFNEDYPYLK